MRQLGQSSRENGFMALPIVRWSKSAADRMIDERFPRRCDPAQAIRPKRLRRRS
jgi:hypothetical protein